MTLFVPFVIGLNSDFDVEQRKLFENRSKNKNQRNNWTQRLHVTMKSFSRDKNNPKRD